jgi:DUF1680 family protein
VPARWEGGPYLPRDPRPAPDRRRLELRAVPYFAWANREPGAMQVWLRETAP